MTNVVKSSIKLSNIALLNRARHEDGLSITIVNVGDPRNSIVTSLDGSTKLVLTKDDLREYINIADAFPEVSELNTDSILSLLPNHPVNLYTTTNSTVHSILFDSLDINERESIICYSNNSESTKALESIVFEHNRTYGLSITQLSQLSDQLSFQLLDSLDDLDELNIIVESNHDYDNSNVKKV